MMGSFMNDSVIKCCKHGRFAHKNPTIPNEIISEAGDRVLETFSNEGFLPLTAHF